MKKLVAPFRFGNEQVLILWTQPQHAGSAEAVESYTEEGYRFVKIDFGGV